MVSSLLYATHLSYSYKNKESGIKSSKHKSPADKNQHNTRKTVLTVRAAEGGWSMPQAGGLREGLDSYYRWMLRNSLVERLRREILVSTYLGSILRLSTYY